MSTKYPKVRNRKVLITAVVAIAVVLSGTIVAYQAISSASAVPVNKHDCFTWKQACAYDKRFDKRYPNNKEYY